MFDRESTIIELMKEDSSMKISYNRLFKLLIDKGMKKTDLAKSAGLTAATLARLSKGQTISMKSLMNICKALNCTFDEIMEIEFEQGE